MSKKKLLIVDDNAALRIALRTLFEDEYELSFAASGEEALVQYKLRTPNVVLMDYRMPGLNGIEVMQRLKSETMDSSVVLMSANDEMPMVVSAMKNGAAGFVSKPFDVQEIKNVVDHAAAASKPQVSMKPIRHSSRYANSPMPVISESEVNQMISQTLRLTCA